MSCVLWYFAAGGDTGNVLLTEMFTQGDKQVWELLSDSASAGKF